MEYEQKRREKQERKEAQEEFQEQIKSLMNMKMLEVVDPKSAIVSTVKPLSYKYFISASNKFTLVLSGVIL
jgi:hypothetical protein